MPLSLSLVTVICMKGTEGTAPTPSLRWVGALPLLDKMFYRGCLWDNWKPTILSRLASNWRTFSRRVTVRWSRGWAKTWVLTNQNSRNSWCHIVRRTICIMVSWWQLSLLTNSCSGYCLPWIPLFISDYL